MEVNFSLQKPIMDPCVQMYIDTIKVIVNSKVWNKKKGPHIFARGAKTVSFRAKLKFKGCYQIVLRINLRYDTSL